MSASQPQIASRALRSSIALHALWLHGAWEVAQCLLFYDMEGASVASSFFLMAGAMGADVALSLILIAVALGITRLQRPVATRLFFVTLAVCGAVTAIFIELLAWKFGWWRYSSAMPSLRFYGQAIGLSPVLQMALLPSLAFFLARFPSHRRQR